MKKISLMIATIALVMTGCSGSSPTETKEVRSVSMSFEPKEINITKGQRSKVILTNTDTLLHDWSIEIPAKVHKSEGGAHGHGDTKGVVHVAADAGRVASVEFTPTKAGTFVIYCTVPGHKEAGMTGTLTVH